MTPTLTTKTPDHPPMTHFTQNTLATTTQTPGGHHTQITPHPKRPSETHTPHPKQKNTPPTSPTPHTTPNTPKTQPNPNHSPPQTTPPDNHTHTLYPCPQKVAPNPTDTQPPNTPRPTSLPEYSIHFTPRAHLPAPHRHHPPHATTLTLRVSFANAHSTHPVLNSATPGQHAPCTPRQGTRTPGPPGDPAQGSHANRSVPNR